MADLLINIVKTWQTRGPKYIYVRILLFYLHGLKAAHAAASAAPHEAKPLDPVVSSHGGVPTPARPYLHAASQGDAAEHDLDIRYFLNYDVLIYNLDW